MPTRNRNQISALQDAIDARASAPVILVWIRHRPRVTTLRPVAHALAANGFQVVVA
ncbi:hypothetical protein ILP92_16630 [Maribius pontilimi]|uniref:Uncharacterized protein n=1 Tax=Palleronia pontilimi TaxID=1964209 RepID=A0A934IK22_9RHOB|nr:hypothetical protein [Palleronia pontilimi]MBJ3764368.1 hypothetical protein [Palleronia pontilimi]